MILIPTVSEDQNGILSLAKTRLKHSPLNEECFHSYLENKDILFYSYKKEERVVGYLILRLEGEEAELDEIVIAEEIQGEGEGSLLLQEGSRLLKERGIKTLFLEVRSQNERAKRLYERQGFVYYRKRKNYYPDDDALCYKKEL